MIFMADQQQQGQNTGKVLGGSLVLKLLLILGIVLIASIFFFGVKLDLMDLGFNAIKIIFGAVLIIFVIKGIQSILKKPDYSATKSFNEKLIYVAEFCKPSNISELWLRGEDMRLGSLIGKITGLGFIPYFSSTPENDEKGNPLMVEKRDGLGQVIFQQTKTVDGKIVSKPIMIPKMKYLTEKDGDWLFVVKKGFWIFGKKLMIRANPRFVSELATTVYLKTVNLIPAGSFYYPNQQWQDDIYQILTQHKAEIVVETHEHFLDLIASITHQTLSADPHFQKQQYATSEPLQTGQSGYLMQGGNNQQR